jgi:ribonuclease BN (tRNA processing enzyme)
VLLVLVLLPLTNLPVLQGLLIRVTIEMLGFSHGHMDHIAGIGSHISIRALRGSKPPTYYIPTHLQEPLVKVLEGYSAMTEEKILDQVHLQPVDPGADIKVSGVHDLDMDLDRYSPHCLIIWDRKSQMFKDQQNVSLLPQPVVTMIASEMTST